MQSRPAIVHRYAACDAGNLATASQHRLSASKAARGPVGNAVFEAEGATALVAVEVAVSA